MASSFLTTDFALLGYDIPEKPVADTSGYTVYNVTAVAGIDTINAAFVCLKTACTNDDAKTIPPFLTNATQSFVVLPSSQQERLTKLRSIIGNKPKYLIYEDLIWQKVKATFGSYLTSLGEGVFPPDPYVTPRPIGHPHDSLDDQLIDWLADRQHAGDNMRVVRAAAGIGKTSLARKITRRMTVRADKDRRIPVYVESEHWAKLKIESLDDLWGMIDNSLRHFDSALRVSRNLFEHLLRGGHLVFIFDGFDELCGHRLSPFVAREVVEQLRGLVATSDARVLLTTRTMYWNSEIGEAPEGVTVVDLAPFSKPQAHDYFEKRFRADTSMRRRAHGLLDRLRGFNQPPTPGGGHAQITYQPFVVELVAKLADEGDGGISDVAEHGSDLFRILYSLCEREVVRRKLETSASEQLAAFQEIAIDCVTRGERYFNADDCEICGFKRADRPRLLDHPLLTAVLEFERFQFRFDFLPPLLLARYATKAIIKCAQTQCSPTESFRRLMDREAAGKSFVMDHMEEFWEGDLSSVGTCYSLLPREADRERSFLFHLAKALLSRHHANFNRRERTDALLTLFGDPPNRLFSNLTVVGNIEKLDLRGVRFRMCRLTNTLFADCTVDVNTAFEGCTFVGECDVDAADRGSWSAVQISGCEMEGYARFSFQDIRGAGPGLSDDNLKEALQIALNKFWHSGRLKSSIARPDWTKGLIGRVAIGKEILNAMLKLGLVYEIEISGVREGGYAFDRRSVADLQRFMDNRELTGKIKALYDQLRTDLA